MPSRHSEESDAAPRVDMALESEAGAEVDETPAAYTGMTRAQAWNLYGSHLLSTWNMRTYEFAAIIFTAAAYPDTLIASSIRGVVRTLAAVCFSSSVGHWVDRGPDRLETLLKTISLNRISVICASICWFLIVAPKDDGASDVFILKTSSAYFDQPIKRLLFVLVLLFGILEGLSATGNVLSMERDWVVTTAAPAGQPYDLTQLNSATRRIDLVCKLLAPIATSVFISMTSIRKAAILVGAMSLVSWGLEHICARNVWDRNSRLREAKFVQIRPQSSLAPELRRSVTPRLFISKLRAVVRRFIEGFSGYFSTNVWIPSLALSLLHISVLAYNASFITFLLNAGFSLDLITMARALGSLVEISSTVVTPFGVQYLSAASTHGNHHSSGRDDEFSAAPLLGDTVTLDERKTETGLERFGLWGITWQLLNLIPVVLTLWSITVPLISPPDSISSLVIRLLIPLTSQPVRAAVLFVFLSLSRLGLWIFDLTTQQLTQTLVPPPSRATFSGVEMSLVSVFDLSQNLLLLVFHRPEQFRYVALVSWIAVLTSAAMYAFWVRRVRGHLVHWEKLGARCAGWTAGLHS